MDLIFLMKLKNVFVISMCTFFFKNVATCVGGKGGKGGVGGPNVLCGHDGEDGEPGPGGKGGAGGKPAMSRPTKNSYTRNWDSSRSSSFTRIFGRFRRNKNNDSKYNYPVSRKIGVLVIYVITIDFNI